MQFSTAITNLLLFLVKISILRMKIVKYECILACNSSHFSNFTGNNCSNYTHKSSFSRALIWYEVLCDIIFTLTCMIDGCNEKYVYESSTICTILFLPSSGRKEKKCMILNKKVIKKPVQTSSARRFRRLFSSLHM